MRNTFFLLGGGGRGDPGKLGEWPLTSKRDRDRRTRQAGEQADKQINQIDKQRQEEEEKKKAQQSARILVSHITGEEP